LIVFVCEHGSAKSLIAASFCERLAKQRGVAVRAVSRGTSPDASVPDAVVEALHEDGFDVAAFEPRALSDADVSTAACVIAIGIDLGYATARAGTRLERWDDIPPVSSSYRDARRVIVSRLRSLLRSLERRA
jgi:protein-tyrosine-phosphatase